jgi:hypothetical protein
MMEHRKESTGWEPASKRFMGAVVMTWIVLAVLHLLTNSQRGEATEPGSHRSLPTRNWAPDTGSGSAAGTDILGGGSGGSDGRMNGTIPAELIAIPLVAAPDDRSPGIRVDAMPFGPPDVSTIWGLSCEGSLVPLFLDASSGDLFALAAPQTVWPNGMLCQAFAANNRKYWVQFDLKNVRFMVQGTPEFKPI